MFLEGYPQKALCTIWFYFSPSEIQSLISIGIMRHLELVTKLNYKRQYTKIKRFRIHDKVFKSQFMNMAAL